MTVKKLKLTWDKAGARWRKIYKGKVWYGKRGVKKSDDEAYSQAVEDFEQWRGDISKQAEKDKPNAEQYENQIGIREEMVRICLLEGEMEQEFVAQ